MKKPSSLVLPPEEMARFEAAVRELLDDVERVDRRIRRHQSELGRLRRRASDRPESAKLAA